MQYKETMSDLFQSMQTFKPTAPFEIMKHQDVMGNVRLIRHRACSVKYTASGLIKVSI